jgi:hypothetical protein
MAEETVPRLSNIYNYSHICLTIEVNTKRISKSLVSIAKEKIKQRYG